MQGHAACVATSVEYVVGCNFRSTGVVCRITLLGYIRAPGIGVGVGAHNLNAKLSIGQEHLSVKPTAFTKC
jgi:hypothetical protein